MAGSASGESAGVAAMGRCPDWVGMLVRTHPLPNGGSGGRKTVTPG